MHFIREIHYLPEKLYFIFCMTYFRFRQAGDFTARRRAHAGCPD